MEEVQRKQKTEKMSNNSIYGDEPVVVLVEGAGAASGVYQKNGMSDGVTHYTMETKGQGGPFYLSRCDNNDDDGAKIWQIEQKGTVGTAFGAVSNFMWYKAPMCLEDPNYPPSKGWYRAMAIAPIRICVTVMTPRKQQFAANYKEILFSEDYSDATIICEDQVAIPVHKNILAASSPYFKAAFSGDWAENESGVIKTSYPAHIIKEMLARIYTGVSTTNFIQEDPLGFISVASEFDLPWLKTLVEPICVGFLDENNLKAMWQSSRLYESEPLKTACIDFAKKNAVAVLTNSTIVDLKSEEPASWEDFAKAVATSSS